MRKKKILLVDDSEIYRETARYMLESRGYEVVILSSPFAFGASITREHPDLALVDAFMPALQGDQLIRLARQNNLWDCPIILHSDRSVRELQQMVEACGAAGFLAKTNDADKLSQAIEGFLRDVKPMAVGRRPLSAPMDPLSVRRGAGSPESRRSFTPQPDSYRPPLDSYRPPPESYRGPPESRSPPESRRPPPPHTPHTPLPQTPSPQAPSVQTPPPPPPETRRPGRS